MIQEFLLFNDWAILVIRIVLGIIFIAHGFRKASHFKNTLAWFSDKGFKPGWLWGTIVTGIEIIGGLFILTGFLAQPSAVVIALLMLVAILFNFRKKAPFFKVLELDILLFASLLLLATLGNGFFSLNNLFRIIIF